MPTPPPRQPQSGDLLRVTWNASVQFRVPILFRVARVVTRVTDVPGWLWLDGYELDATGRAVEQRSIYVQTNGLEWPQTLPPQPARQPRNTSRARVYNRPARPQEL